MRLNTRIIIHLMGLLLLCNGGFMLLAALVSGLYKDGATFHITLAALATLFTGMVAAAAEHKQQPRKSTTPHAGGRICCI